MKKISEEEIDIIPDLYWKGKLLLFTWHFKKEYEHFRKPWDYVLEILNRGEHHLISKNRNKYNVFYPYHRKYLCLSYSEQSDVILIHIKPITKKPK